MVKGISRQVIVVRGADPKLFEQAIFILKDRAVEQGVTEDDLLKEARRLAGRSGKKRSIWLYGPAWACGGAIITGMIWLATMVL